MTFSMAALIISCEYSIQEIYGLAVHRQLWRGGQQKYKKKKNNSFPIQIQILEPG